MEILSGLQISSRAFHFSSVGLLKSIAKVFACILLLAAQIVKLAAKRI